MQTSCVPQRYRSGKWATTGRAARRMGEDLPIIAYEHDSMPWIARAGTEPALLETHSAPPASPRLFASARALIRLKFTFQSHFLSVLSSSKSGTLARGLKERYRSSHNGGIIARVWAASRPSRKRGNVSLPAESRGRNRLREDASFGHWRCYCNCTSYHRTVLAASIHEIDARRRVFYAEATAPWCP